MPKQPNGTPRLSANQRQALELLASDPHGATEQLLVVAHGFDSDMIAGLVGSGLRNGKAREDEGWWQDG
jgi:hypothetical protein